MIDYKLALKLKEAGFPHSETWFDKDEIMLDLTEHYFVPTLSELIEACGDGFQWLSKKKKEVWIATGEINDDVNSIEEVIGKTPLIAVAKLYIKLHA